MEWREEKSVFQQFNQIINKILRLAKLSMLLSQHINEEDILNIGSPHNPTNEIGRNMNIEDS